MAEQDKDKYIDRRSDQGDDELIDQEIQESLAEDQNLDYGARQLQRELNSITDASPVLAGGDVDADWPRADDVGEEAVGGSVATPDQDMVDELGEAAGLTYSDTEPLHTADKLARRDRQRWELDPASSPDYQERIREEFGQPPAKDKEEE